MAGRKLLTVGIFLLLLPVTAGTAQAQFGNLFDCPASTLFASNMPEQVHIALLDDPQQMQVSWATPGQTDSEVEYGLEEDLSQSASGDEECYDHDMVFHTATMTGLVPASNYSYRVGDGSSWSSIFTFSTYDPASPVEFYGFGDHGMSSEALVTGEIIEDNPLDLLILSGDISYANGDQSVWDDYFRENEPSMSAMPWMVVPGNHENETGYGFDAYETRYEIPNDSNTDLYHAFTVGPVRFIGISTEHDFSAGSTQFSWLTGELVAANANRDSTPWLVVYGHKPMYTSHGDETGHDINDIIRQQLEPLFVDNQVDVVIWGHDHFYERTWPVIDSVVQEKGTFGKGGEFAGSHAPIHLIVGTAGRGSYDYSEEQPEWSLYREKSHGLMRFNASMDSMLVEYMRYDGVIGDSFILLNGEATPTPEDDGGFLPAEGVIFTLMTLLLAARRQQWFLE